MRLFKLHIVLFFIIRFTSYGQIPWVVNTDPPQFTNKIVFEAGFFSQETDIVLEVGDGIGAFFEMDNKYFCGGFIEWNGFTDTLNVIGVNTGQQGFKLGEEIKLRHWDNSEECIHDIEYSIYRNSTLLSALPFSAGAIDSTQRVSGANITFSYFTTFSCNDLSDTLEPLIRDAGNFLDDSLSYVFTATPTGLAIADSNGFIILNQSQSNTYQINLETEYCASNSSFELPVYPNLNPDAGTDFVFSEYLSCGQDSVTIIIDSAFFERGVLADFSIYITDDLENLNQDTLPNPTPTLTNPSVTLGEGEYFLSIRNYTILGIPSCIDTFKVEIIDFCNVQEGEEKPILVPDLVGDYQQFAISDTGNVKIYNKEGRLVNRLKAPTIWKGTDLNDNLLPMGLYFILIDERKKYEITVLR